MLQKEVILTCSVEISANCVNSNMFHMTWWQSSLVSVDQVPTGTAESHSEGYDRYVNNSWWCWPHFTSGAARNNQFCLCMMFHPHLH